jgi:predicted transcriptional regulator
MVSREMLKVVVLCGLAFVVWGVQLLGGSSIKTGDVPEVVELAGNDGGRLDGRSWSSSELKSKVHILMYIDPDHKSDNEALQAALREQDYGPERLGSVAIINMAATWIPNAAINATLASKQKEFPNTIYVKDLKTVVGKKWGLADNAYCVLLFDKEGRLLFRKDGKLTEDEVKTVVRLAWQQIDPSKSL